MIPPTCFMLGQLGNDVVGVRDSKVAAFLWRLVRDVIRNSFKPQSRLAVCVLLFHKLAEMNYFEKLSAPSLLTCPHFSKKSLLEQPKHLLGCVL